jgi:hypothetical protein
MINRPWSAIIDDGLTDAMNEAGRSRHLLPIYWHLLPDIGVTGHVTDTDRSDDEHAVIALQWADVLGLTEVAGPSCAGTTEYRGTVEGRPFSIWAVIDRAAFERAIDR